MYDPYAVKREADIAKKVTLCAVPKYTEIRIVVDKLNNSVHSCSSKGVLIWVEAGSLDI